MYTSVYYYLFKTIGYVYLFMVLSIYQGDVFNNVVLILGFILLSQINQYLIKDGKYNIIFKIFFLLISVGQVTLIHLLANNLGSIMYYVLALILFDIIIYYKVFISTAIVAVFSISSIYLFYTSPSFVVETFILFIVSEISLILICYYLKTLQSKKKIAQDYYDKLRISEEKLVEANEELKLYSSTIEELTLHRERSRVSRELHDSVGHSLSTLCIQLKAVRTILSKNTPLAEEMLDNNVKYVENALENVRRTVRELKPIEFEAYEGIFTIEQMIKSSSKLTGINIKMIVSKEKWILDSDQIHNLYRIVQECISNAQRHGKAKNITVSLQFFEDKLYTCVNDDGIGVAEVAPSFGLKGISERVKGMGGSVDYESEAGKGFSVKLTLPRYKKL